MHCKRRRSKKQVPFYHQLNTADDNPPLSKEQERILSLNALPWVKSPISRPSTLNHRSFFLSYTSLHLSLPFGIVNTIMLDLWATKMWSTCRRYNPTGKTRDYLLKLMFFIATGTHPWAKLRMSTNRRSYQSKMGDA